MVKDRLLRKFIVKILQFMASCQCNVKAGLLYLDRAPELVEEVVSQLHVASTVEDSWRAGQLKVTINDTLIFMSQLLEWFPHTSRLVVILCCSCMRGCVGREGGREKRKNERVKGEREGEWFEGVGRDRENE